MPFKNTAKKQHELRKVLNSSRDAADRLINEAKSNADLAKSYAKQIEGLAKDANRLSVDEVVKCYASKAHSAELAARRAVSMTIQAARNIDSTWFTPTEHLAKKHLESTKTYAGRAAYSATVARSALQIAQDALQNARYAAAMI